MGKKFIVEEVEENGGCARWFWWLVIGFILFAMLAK